MNKNGKGTGKHNTSVITQSKGLQASDGDFFFWPANPFGITLCFGWLPFSAGRLAISLFVVFRQV